VSWRGDYTPTCCLQDSRWKYCYASDLKGGRAAVVRLKGVELANLAADTLAEVTAAAQRGIHRIRATYWLPYSFLRSCGLSLW
jgi:hypothetical protein